MSTPYPDRLDAAVRAKRTPAIVGLDPVLEKLPAELQPAEPTLEAAVAALERFCCEVIDLVAPHVPGVKPNAAFFEAYYAPGLAAYYRVVAHAHARGLLVIGDIKRGDIGSTAARYAAGHIAPAQFGLDPACIPDAVTLAGYLGENAVRPFVEAAREEGRGVYVLVRPSEPKADEVHEFDAGGAGPRFYEHMAALVDRWGREHGVVGECGLSNVGAVVAAKDRDSTAALRAGLPQTPLLIPGYGAQGGTAEDCRALFLEGGRGAVINASRSVIYAFAKPERAEKHGDDWRGAIKAACEDFARDVAPLID
jgi:orotidine-5'-phosphate decarboxylase